MIVSVIVIVAGGGGNGVQSYERGESEGMNETYSGRLGSERGGRGTF